MPQLPVSLNPQSPISNLQYHLGVPVKLLDGVPNGDVSGNPQGVSGVMNGSETIKEIQIVTNNSSAEYKSAVACGYSSARL